MVRHLFVTDAGNLKYNSYNTLHMYNSHTVHNEINHANEQRSRGKH